MRHLRADEVSEISGIGYAGEVIEGVDGLYEWVDGVDAWGGPIGFWQGLSEVQIDGSELGGLGALYEASDGSLYQMHGLGEEDEPAGAESDDGDASPPAAVKMGPGRPGEMRVGPDGKKYRWVLGVGPGGKRTGFWRHMRPRPGHPQAAPAPRAHHAAPPRPGARPPAGAARKRKPFLKRLLPFAKIAASLIPIPGAGAAVKAGLNIADKALTRKGVSGYDGLGALYEAPDGSVYRVQGFSEDELHGLYGDRDLDGFAANDELDGLAVDHELDGFPQGQEIQGFAADFPPQVGDEDLHGYDPHGHDLRGYVQEPRMGGLQAYVPEPPRETRMFEAPRETPDIWKPLW